MKSSSNNKHGDADNNWTAEKCRFFFFLVWNILYKHSVKAKLIVVLSCLLSLVSYGQEEASFDPQFSVQGGMHSQPFDLVLSCENPGASIYYTTDGGKPSSHSRRYQRPIHIDGVKVIRARAYVDGKPSDIITQSYFLGRTHTMPVVSLCTDSSNLFSVERGIYVKGTGGLPNYPYRGANYWKSWERETNFEYYETDNTQAINQRVGIKIFGGWSRPLPQKSLAIISRKKYGEKYMRHRFFRDKELDKFKGLVLRNSGSDFNKAQFRDAFMTSLMRNTDLELQAYQPVVVYINGEYWGVQNLREKINEHFVRFNCGADPDSVDMLKHRDDLKNGTRKHYRNMLQYLKTHDLAVQEHFDSVAKLMDWENYAHYNIAETYYDNHDAGGNIRYWRPTTDGGRWRWILFDTDFGFSIGNWKAYKTNTLAMFTDPAGPRWPNPPWSTFIIRKLLENEGFERHYINQWADHLNTTFHADTVEAHLDYFHDLYEPEMESHFKRWTFGGAKMERWETTIKVMRDFAINRPTYCRQHLMQKFELADTVNIALSVNDKTMGHVVLNSITVDDGAFEGIYFKGVPVTISAHPRFDYEFVGWEGIESTEAQMEIDPTGDLNLQAIFQPKSLSAQNSEVIFNEVAYDQEGVAQSDWIELYNRTEKLLDLSGWLLKDAEDEHLFTMPEGSTLAAGEYMLLCQNVDSFLQSHSDTLPIAGSFGFGLSSQGELIRLYDQNGYLVDSLTYRKGDTGVVALNDPTLQGHVPANWSDEKGGTPGQINREFQATLDRIAAEEHREKMMTIGGIGGGVLLILIVLFVMRRKRKKALAS